MNKGTIGEYDENLRPTDSLMTQDRPELSLDFDDKSDRGMVKRVHLRALSISTDDIADLSITGAKIAVNAISNTKISAFDWNKGTGGTITGATINSDLITGGTIKNAVVGTPAITGGTFASGVVNNPTIGTPAITGGTYNTGIFGTPTITGGTITALVGTSQLTGGTVNPAVYQTSGSAGVSGTFAGSTAPNMKFVNGIFMGTA